MEIESRIFCKYSHRAIRRRIRKGCCAGRERERRMMADYDYNKRFSFVKLTNNVCV